MHVDEKACTFKLTHQEYQQLVDAVKQEEREACAKIADEGACYGTAEGAEDMAKAIARLIRNRTDD